MDRAARAPTLGDVASLAGVSPSTVSNVVRGSDVVAAPTRRRVLAAIEQLAYRPNALARHLRRHRAATIGVVAHDLGNPFFAEMASRVEREVARFGYAAMFSATDGDVEREARAIGLMLENRISGMVFLSFLRRPSQIRAKINGQVPAVFVAAHEPWADSVTVDEQRGGEMVARHLIELGHQRLAFVGPHHPDRADARRLEGFCRAAADAGLEPSIIAWDPPDGPLSRSGATAEWRQILTGPDAATGIFAANDFAAIDLLDVADTLGIRVPDELSVVGFDDVDMARLRRINLTTIRQPRETLVRLGVEALLGRIDGRLVGDPSVTLTDASLMVRGSSGRPPPNLAEIDPATPAARRPDEGDPQGARGGDFADRAVAGN